MANLPTVQDDKFQIAITNGLAAGLGPADMAKRLYPDDRAARKRMRRRIWRMLAKDERLAMTLAERAQAELRAGLIPMTQALVRRGTKGNVPAVKLALEASGFHNPRVQHEHSGEITVKLDMPRPNFAEASGEIVDAEVVEDK